MRGAGRQEVARRAQRNPDSAGVAWVKAAYGEWRQQGRQVEAEELVAAVAGGSGFGAVLWQQRAWHLNAPKPPPMKQEHALPSTG